MKNKICALAVLCSLLDCTGNLIAQGRRGAELVVVKTDDQLIQGELIAVKENSLLLLESKTGADIFFNIDEVSIITVVRKSKGLVGFLGGAGLGTLFGLMVASGQSDMTFAPLSIGRFTAIFALGGLLGGEMAGRDRIYKFEEKNSEESKKILIELRSQARIANFQ
jgi:hypothetical protein